MTRYALVSALVPIPDDQKSIPGEWVDKFPDRGWWACDVFDENAEIEMVLSTARLAMMRKIERDGLP